MAGLGAALGGERRGDGQEIVALVCVETPTGEFLRVGIEKGETVGQMKKKSKAMWEARCLARRGTDPVGKGEWAETARVAVGMGGVYMLLAEEAKVAQVSSGAGVTSFCVINDKKDIDTMRFRHRS